MFDITVTQMSVGKDRDGENALYLLDAAGKVWMGYQAKRAEGWVWVWDVVTLPKDATS
jgi:hypothetical protein